MLIFLNVFGAFVFVVNSIVDANYMFISKPTLQQYISKSSRSHPWYLLSLEGITLFNFLYTLFTFLNSELKPVIGLSELKHHSKQIN